MFVCWRAQIPPKFCVTLSLTVMSRSSSSSSGERSKEDIYEYGTIKSKSRENPFSNFSIPSFEAKGPPDPNQLQLGAPVPEEPKGSKDVPDNFEATGMLGPGTNPSVKWLEGRMTGKVVGNRRRPDTELVIRMIQKDWIGGFLAFFRNEKQILDILKHRHILPCLGWWEDTDDDDPDEELILMPFPKCVYRSMGEIITEDVDTWIARVDVKNYMGQIAQALQ